MNNLIFGNAMMSKVIKFLVLSFSIITLTACSLCKTNRDNKSSEIKIDNTYSNDMNSENASFNEEARIQIQKLQQNNVVYFDLNKYDIHPDFNQMLDLHASFLRNHPICKIILEGHTDERGTPEYNIALGERRANSIKMYLQGKGVSSDQITIVSYGKEKPAVLGYDEAAYSKNRRAVLVY